MGEGEPPSEGQAVYSKSESTIGGHYNYFGVKGNERAVRRFYNEAIESAYKWLNRRGGKKNSFNWKSFTIALTRLKVAIPRVFDTGRKRVVYN